jgi:hypothetical protein
VDEPITAVVGSCGRGTVTTGGHNHERQGDDHYRQDRSSNGYPAPAAQPSDIRGVHLTRETARRLRRYRLQGIQEVAALATEAPLDYGDRLEFEPDHGYAPMEDLLDQILVSPRAGDKPHQKIPRAFLHNLEIP